MKVEVDQSGRVEDLSTGTAVAFSNGKSGAVFVSAGVKRRIIVYVRQNSLVSSSDIPAILFSILVYILIADFELTALNIDEEYTGKHSIIEETINKLYVRFGVRRIPNLLFVRIGKRSPAHKLAWEAHRSKGRLKIVRKLREKELLKLIVFRGKRK